MPANPFEFEAANKFTVEEMVDYFIPDETYTRFVESRKNVFLLGDRGTGKTMALRFYSLPVQHFLAGKGEKPVAQLLDFIGIYVPCRKPGLGKTEPELLSPFLGRLTGEHLLVTAMIFSLAESLASVPDLLTPEEDADVRQTIPDILPWELPDGVPLFDGLARTAKKEWILAQRELNKRVIDSHYDNVVTFSTAFQPLVEMLTNAVARLKKSHFSLMFDDAEELSDYQNETVNSWIAVRDTSRISFKVATSAVDQRPLTTTTGGGLLERHDFLRVDLEQDFQNSEASYGRLARKIVNRRLSQAGINTSADVFFPANPTFVTELAAASEKARADAESRGLEGRQVRDYVNKVDRALYFRGRPATANRPPYSGFDLLVHVSTGVIRYLLEPCYEMYDRAVSAQDDKSLTLEVIPPAVQTVCLQEMSKRRWEWIGDGFNASVKDCTRADATNIHQLLDQLAVLFKYRLLNHQSEPRAISFSVSAPDKISVEQREQLDRLFRSARRAQILFARLSTGKDDGRQDKYYTFDRLLWIDRGLDPVGQNARVSIEARFLWAAAFENKPLPSSPEEKLRIDRGEAGQLSMFEGGVT
ncbi:ORC-CDC6 family AAA ATPase [Oleiharenicola lentus]|uniref:ORC-CDC6 family AAA ATPase n=1 Tax=Oleiharenicola lentus TaxID=2508720 RepID=UPI003F6647D9